MKTTYLKSALVLTAMLALAVACTKKEETTPAVDTTMEETTTTTLPDASGSATEMAPADPETTTEPATN